MYFNFELIGSQKSVVDYLPKYSLLDIYEQQGYVYPGYYKLSYFYNKFKQYRMAFLQDILSHFSVNLTEQSLALTLINPNITVQIMNQIKTQLCQLTTIKQLEIVIIQCPNFDDELLTILASSIPQTLTSLSLDFTGCQSLRGEGFLQLFQNLDGLQLTKLKLDLGEVYDINDIVIEGLVMLLSNLDQLKQFYLDLYEVDQITEDGYLLLAQGLSELSQLVRFHIDLSANYNLTEDALEILFGGQYSNLTEFSFKIIDIQQIGGGSFFKLGECLTRMVSLESLALTISTFSSLNQKAIYSIIKGINRLQKLQKLYLNLSNTNLSQKLITYLTLSPKLKQIDLDISCNRLISFNDFLNLSSKLKKIPKIKLNLDFCLAIDQDTLEEFIDMVQSQNKCTSLVLTDRIYSSKLQSYAVQKLRQINSLLTLQVCSDKISPKLSTFQQFLFKKRKFLAICQSIKANRLPQPILGCVLEQIFYYN